MNKPRILKVAAVASSLALATGFIWHRSNSSGFTFLPGPKTTAVGIISAQLIEFTDGNEDTYQILDTSPQSRPRTFLPGSKTGLGDSNTDSIFVIQDID